jgi:hypothetical protein
MLLAATISPTIVASVVLALLAAGVAALVRRRRRLAGTTLSAVWTWSLVSLLSVSLAEVAVAMLGGNLPQSWIAPLRFVAAASSFCPVMALLGAKRPQDRGWQFIVVALWGIVSLPAAHWLLFGGVREIHPAQVGLLAILIGVGALNRLATRTWLAGAAYALGQVALLGPYFASLQPWLADERGPLVGLALLVASWLLLAMQGDRSRAARGLDRVWLDFRDAFGAVWGLRVMERMNASADMYDWPVMLVWQGFIAKNQDSDMVETPQIVEDSLRTLLRRFVSPTWIDERLAGGGNPQPPTNGQANASSVSAGNATG